MKSLINLNTSTLDEDIDKLTKSLYLESPDLYDELTNKINNRIFDEMLLFFATKYDCLAIINHAISNNIIDIYAPSKNKNFSSTLDHLISVSMENNVRNVYNYLSTLQNTTEEVASTSSSYTSLNKDSSKNINLKPLKKYNYSETINFNTEDDYTIDLNNNDAIDDINQSNFNDRNNNDYYSNSNNNCETNSNSNLNLESYNNLNFNVINDSKTKYYSNFNNNSSLNANDNKINTSISEDNDYDSKYNYNNNSSINYDITHTPDIYHESNSNLYGNSSIYSNNYYNNTPNKSTIQFICNKCGANILESGYSVCETIVYKFSNLDFKPIELDRKLLNPVICCNCNSVIENLSTVKLDELYNIECCTQCRSNLTINGIVDRVNLMFNENLRSFSKNQTSYHCAKCDNKLNNAQIKYFNL